MSDADMSETVYVSTEEMPGMSEVFGDIGCVIYQKSFTVTGICVWMIPKLVGENYAQ
jgi:hypothetical protein